MKVAGAIFDLDGTILDSMGIWRNMAPNYLKRNGFTPTPNLEEELKPLSYLEGTRYVRELYHIDRSMDDILQEIDAYLLEQYSEHIPLKPGVASVLHSLQSQQVKMCIATATDRRFIEPALVRLGILDCFEGILTCSEVGAGKSQPLIYEKALELMHTKKEETLVFEDAFHAVKTAKQAGFYVIGVRDAYAATNEAEIRACADRYLLSLEEWDGSL